MTTPDQSDLLMLADAVKSYLYFVDNNSVVGRTADEAATANLLTRESLRRLRTASEAAR